MKKLLLLLMTLTVLSAISCTPTKPDEDIETIPLTPLLPSLNLNKGLDSLFEEDNPLNEYFEKSEVIIDSAESLMDALKNPEFVWRTKKEDNTIQNYSKEVPAGITANEVILKAHPKKPSGNLLPLIDVVGNKENIYLFYSTLYENGQSFGKKSVGFSLVFIKENGYGKIVNIPKFDKLDGMGFEDISSNVAEALTEETKKSLGDDYQIFVLVNNIQGVDIAGNRHFGDFGKGQSIFTAQKK